MQAARGLPGATMTRTDRARARLLWPSVTAPRTRTVRVVLLVILSCLLAVAGFFAVGSTRQYLADRSFHPIVIPAATAPTGKVAAALSTAAPAAPRAQSDAPQPSPAGVAAVLASALASPELGSPVSAQVLDAATGTSLFSERASAIVAPASTMKLLTAAAVLLVHKSTDRFTTKVVAGADPGTVVLVGGGDPTLSGAPAGQQSEYAEAARMSDLAAQVRAAAAGTPITKVVVDSSLFSGPGNGVGWAPEDSPSSYGAPITAAMVDAGRDTPDAVIRSANPDLAAGNALAAGLGAAAVSRGTAPAAAKVLGQVRSAPLAVIVEQMLRDSDNTMADVLARQVALAEHQPASFLGSAAAMKTALASIGIPIGTTLQDGSGLSVLDRIPAVALTQVLVKAVSTPALRPLLTGMPVAGWEGSLVEQNRFVGADGVGHGVVRAKTGSLTGVSSLAGVVTDADGRQLIFAFVADHAPTEGPTRTAIDDLVVSLTKCGCRA
jgi:D-alanyl-D-alanine carboxypeptidase/D-alanyl-D-alanine-endopeptidase (penicillin-binding protein 4)